MSTMPASAHDVQHFQAFLEKGDRALGWTIARVPFDPAAMWPERVRLRVKGTINGFAFRTSLFPVADRPGTYCLLVNKRMQAEARVCLGHAAEFTLEPDLEPRPAELPEELDALLDEAEGLRGWYESLSENTRRQIGTYLRDAKSDAARIKRAEQIAERMLFAMEGEAERASEGSRWMEDDDANAATHGIVCRGRVQVARVSR